MPPAGRRRLLVGSLLAVTLHAFDELAVVTALPAISDDLGGRGLYGAALFAYLLTSLVGLVLGGAGSALRGPAFAFAGGLVVFAAGLALSALAPTMAIVVAGRALQGLGGGVISSTVLVVVQRGFPAEERPRVLALNASAWVVPALLAPGAAGVAVELVSWRLVFAGLLPLVALAAVLGLPAMRALPAAAAPQRALRRDLGEGVRLAVGLGLGLAALARPLDLVGAAAFVAGCALAAAPLRRILPDGIASLRPVLPAAIAFKGLLVFAFFGTEAFVPLALGEIHDASAARAGLALTCAALAWTWGAHVQARLARSLGERWLAAAGASALLAAIATMLLLLDPRVADLWAFAAWALAGFGMGVSNNVAVVAAMAHTPEDAQEHTATALGVIDAVAISLATGVGGAILAAAQRGRTATSDALELVWLLMAGAAVVAALASFRLRAPARGAGTLGG